MEEEKEENKYEKSMKKTCLGLSYKQTQDGRQRTEAVPMNSECFELSQPSLHGSAFIEHKPLQSSSGENTQTSSTMLHYMHPTDSSPSTHQS